MARLQQRLGRRTPILVFSLGKVGTTSVANAIELATGRPTIHCHRVTATGTQRDRVNAGIETGRPFQHTWRGEFVRWRLRMPRRPGKRWEIVCGVRDPVAQLISAVFQELGSTNPGSTLGSMSLSSLRDRVTEWATAGRTGLDWFESELRTVTGINVFNVPFDTARGWQIYENDRFRVLVIRYEDLACAIPAALRSMFDLDRDPHVPAMNVGGEKAYGNRYRRFVAEAHLPGWIVDDAYVSQMAQHFYSPAERLAFRARWETP